MAELNEQEKLVNNLMELAIGILVKEVRGAVGDLTPEQRVDFFDRIQKGYCRHCGHEKEGVCHCQNDE